MDEAPATYYYDETNNIRKLYVGPRGLNVAELNVFVLGGVAHAGGPRPLDLAPLREAMRIQKNATEIKLNQVATGSFPDLLRSTKLRTFLRWTQDNGFLIHYHNLDPFYWSVVDIVDSLLRGLDNPMLIMGHAKLKSDLTEILRAEFAVTIDLFHRYAYPNLQPESRIPFLNELIALTERNRPNLSELHVSLLTWILRRGLELDGLVFLEDKTPNRLIHDFSLFYVGRIAMFTQATHILDMEEVIRDRLEAMSITKGGMPATNFRFADSKSEPGIQLADVLVGLLGKMHSYFTRTPIEEVAAARANFTGTSLENAELLRDCIARSDEANVAYLNHVGSLYDIRKLDCFLRFADGAFAER